MHVEVYVPHAAAGAGYVVCFLPMVCQRSPIVYIKAFLYQAQY